MKGGLLLCSFLYEIGCRDKDLETTRKEAFKEEVCSPLFPMSIYPVRKPQHLCWGWWK